MSNHDIICPRCKNVIATGEGEGHVPDTVKFVNSEEEFNLYACEKCGLAFLESK